MKPWRASPSANAPASLGLPALVAAFALAACAPIATGPRPEMPVVPAAPAAPAPAMPSAESAALAAFYAQTQQSLLSHGLLRTDGGAADAGFDAQDLTTNFLRIAFYDEYDPALGTRVQRESASPLKRWVDPIRLSLEFGPSVPAARQATERARVASYLARLQGLTGHPIQLAARNPNFVLYIGNVDERRGLGPRVAQVLPDISPDLIGGITDIGRANFCLVYVNPDETGVQNARAFAVIPSELPDLMSLMCLHEELAQSLGLANDYPRARPSVFNDDMEFALLTPQDEAMLRLLYSPLLTPGMTEAEARPIIQTLAARLLAGES